MSNRKLRALATEISKGTEPFMWASKNFRIRSWISKNSSHLMLVGDSLVAR